MLKKIARFSYRYRWMVVAFWLGILVSISFLANKYGDAFATEVRTKNSESQNAADLLQNRFTARSGSTGNIVIKSSKPITDPEVRASLEKLFAEVSQIPHVKEVRGPYAALGKNQVAPSGKIAYAEIQFDRGFQTLPSSSTDEVSADVNKANISGVQLELGGDVFGNKVAPGSTEAIGIVAAIIILLISFGSLLAAGLPIAMALFGIGIGIAFVKLLSHVYSLPDITIQLASMIGIGVGIDYALFIVTRYRQELRRGKNPENATITAINTAGRSVLFAGTTVVVSLLGMILIGISFISGMGIGAASVVAITMAASVTLLPAILGFAGKNIDKLKLPFVGKEKPKNKSFWYQWSMGLQRRPWVGFIGGLSILVLLALPFFSMRLGSSDASSRPTSDTTRRAYDIMAEGFGPGSNGPLILVSEISSRKDLYTLQTLTKKLNETPGVAYASVAIPNQQLNAAVLQVIPTTAPQDEATSQLISKIRSSIIPEVTKDTDIKIYVGGLTAAFDDLADTLNARLPLFIGIVLALSFLLLLFVFRSILVPVKAVIMNLLSIGAAYGVLVAIFQWGYGKHLLGLGGTGPIESFVPMIMFAILFGLSMDYEVFLLSRIKEEYDQTGDNGKSVAEGLNHTARVITAAALIMVTVFATFILDSNRVIKEFGLGLAAAILIDATIVRMILVPSTMELLGKANWWFPKWLNWLPQAHLEPEEAPKTTKKK